MLPTIRPGDRVELLADHTDTQGNAFTAGQQGDCDKQLGRAMWVDFDPPARAYADGQAHVLGVSGWVPVVKLKRLPQAGRLD